ncbi:MAG: DNA polymerase IV [Clostridia bacterium]|nr:DNA polymerase IV [Clostridia bacterium]
MERVILHIDCNKFYASVECLHRPEIRNKPVAVGGDDKSRHGIILTKNEIASKYDLKVGEPLWSAYKKCPDLVVVPPNFPLYMRFSKEVHKILSDYTDTIEAFGIDESWVDVSKTAHLYGGGEKLAHIIRKRVKSELGITVSIGVSFNKIFAKLGSDYKKPDAVTVISKENFKDIVWPLPANDLLYVGPATYKKLQSHYRYTIGDLANTELELLQKWFGKIGIMLHSYANGYDLTPVYKKSQLPDIKSIGNSTTTPRDLVTNEDVKSVLFVLAESVGRRLREQGFRCKVVKFHARNNKLITERFQKKLKFETDITREIANEAYSLFLNHYNFENPIRSIGIAVSEFSSSQTAMQYDFFTDTEKKAKLERIDKTVDWLKNRYGNYTIQRANLLKTTDISEFNPHDDHIVHPVGVLKTKL